jgi:hypothetical protein
MKPIHSSRSPFLSSSFLILITKDTQNQKAEESLGTFGEEPILNGDAAKSIFGKS